MGFVRNSSGTFASVLEPHRSKLFVTRNRGDVDMPSTGFDSAFKDARRADVETVVCVVIYQEDLAFNIEVLGFSGLEDDTAAIMDDGDVLDTRLAVAGSEADIDAVDVLRYPQAGSREDKAQEYGKHSGGFDDRDSRLLLILILPEYPQYMEELRDRLSHQIEDHANQEATPK
jgi:hypothetical protein